MSLSAIYPLRIIAAQNSRPSKDQYWDWSLSSGFFLIFRTGVQMPWAMTMTAYVTKINLENPLESRIGRIQTSSMLFFLKAIPIAGWFTMENPNLIAGWFGGYHHFRKRVCSMFFPPEFPPAVSDISWTPTATGPFFSVQGLGHRVGGGAPRREQLRLHRLSSGVRDSQGPRVSMSMAVWKRVPW